MTEEIIMDGVDVAGCEYFRKGRCFDCGTQAICCQHPNCYYKQLKRLEQIIEADNKQIELDADCIANYIKEVNKLKQENKELKKFFDSAAKKNTSLEDKIKEYREQYDELYWTIDQLVKDKTKLKQTLEEIRECLSTLSSIDSDFPNTETYLRINDIINKVLDNKLS